MNKKTVFILALFILLGISFNNYPRRGGGHRYHGHHRSYGYPYSGRRYHDGRWAAVAIPAIIGGAVATAEAVKEEEARKRTYEDYYDYYDEDIDVYDDYEN